MIKKYAADTRSRLIITRYLKWNNNGSSRLAEKL